MSALITFEGCEGVGKSTQIQKLATWLRERGKDVLITREPGGSAIAESIRRILLDGKNTAMTAECEALLYAAARVQHLKEVVQPALERGATVLCDRYVHSSLAYQGYGRSLGTEYVRSVNSYALENFMPDCTVFFDLPPELGFARKKGADANDRMETAGLAFHNRVYAGYLAQKAMFPDTFEVVDANGTIDEIFERVLAVLDKHGLIG